MEILCFSGIQQTLPSILVNKMVKCELDGAAGCVSHVFKVALNTVQNKFTEHKKTQRPI